MQQSQIQYPRVTLYLSLSAVICKEIEKKDVQLEKELEIILYFDVLDLTLAAIMFILNLLPEVRPHITQELLC